MKRLIKILLIQIVVIIGGGGVKLIGFWADLKSVWEDFSRPIPLYWIVIAFFAGQIFYFVYDWISQQKETSVEPKEKPKETIEVTGTAEEPNDSPKQEEPERKSQHPDWVNEYTRDEIEGVFWEWEWVMEIGYYDYMISSLKPLCPKCWNELIEYEKDRFGNQKMYCDHKGCSFKHEKRVNRDQIEREIRRRVRTGEWKDAKKRLVPSSEVVEYPTRNAVRQQILPLMKQNKVIFKMYGPDNDYRFNPESEEAIVWKEKVRDQILPNNRKILAILDENKHLLTANEMMILEKFRQHVDDLERRHLRGDYSGGGIKFPQEMETILEEIDDETG